MSAPDRTQVEVSEKEIAAAKNEVAAAKAELAEAKERLVKAEDVLRKAQKMDPVDAQRVDEAKLGIAEAKLGVAEAKLGVAKAEWRAAPENQKAVFLAIVETAQKIVETANKAYDKALGPPTATLQQGVMGAGAQSVNLISSVLETMSAVKSALATIHEEQVASREQQVVSMGALSDGIFALKRVLDARLEECDMSQATQTRHGGIFQFEYLTELPPMVDAADPRVADLERILQKQRSVEGFPKSSELECRRQAIDPFFKQVARVLGCEIINADSASSLLKVRVGNMEFSGNTDILIGTVDALPLLPIEVKPMTGRHGLKGVQFTQESFSHKTQIALQCAAFQAQCSNSRTQFSCLLTNLDSLYVVQIKSYDAFTISTRIFKVVQDGNHFVRAILRAADDNRSVTKDQKQDVAGPWICETTTVFDCDRQDPGVSGIPQVPQGSGLHDENSVAEQGGGDNLSMKAAQMHSNFESLLPTQQQQKSDIRHIYTRLWLRNCASACGQLFDISSISNAEYVSSSWE